MPIGCQTYPVRDALGKDVEGTLQTARLDRLRTIEMCSPPGYEKGGYAPASEVQSAGAAASNQGRRPGLRELPLQFRRAEKQSRRANRVRQGPRPQADDPGHASACAARPRFGDWARACDDLNKIGEQTLKAGIQTGFHNHNGEFEKIDGVLIYDHIMGKLDPKLVKMQFQVSVISMGYEAADVPDQVSRAGSCPCTSRTGRADEKKQVPVGKGAVDWKKLFAAAKKGGVKNYFVELPMEALQPSYQFLHELKA